MFVEVDDLANYPQWGTMNRPSSLPTHYTNMCFQFSLSSMKY